MEEPAYYDTIAPSYEELHGEEQRQKNRIIREALKELNIHPKKVLDIGCGTGIGSEGIGRECIGIDPSKQLLKQCSFPTIQGTAENIPFPDRSFDLVLCITTIHHTDADCALKEIARVAKEYAVITVLKKSPKAEELAESIRRYFEVIQEIEEAKDKIFILKPKPKSNGKNKRRTEACS